ncbi:electron transport complex subunit RsxG [Vibrio mangrovi]|uniref:Ion-translocating oxidoreductase complex subunit G n=1 Tax=Vibrio mangrovi TaxID=474394 RepID=A0A1Y6IRS2_9VIBR|nr:electron transport complex subunit RsxG [Vibrio mangrovi]MDW6003468.1 electron transport complex subunit RsxG [Vibrio mangrovi]SMR99741.1 Electron transport complex protein RnfG [Vibrio mangrovi]
MLTAIRKNGLILAVFACASTGVVATTHYLTQNRIEQQEQKQLLSILDQVIPPQAHDNVLSDACTIVNIPYLTGQPTLHAYVASQNNTPTGLAIETIAPDGYNGAIKLIVGIDNEGVITGTRVLSHQETPGLGDRIDLRITDWILAFTGKKVTAENESQWKVRKDGGQFDQFTGATITPRAVVKAVKRITQFVDQNREQLYRQPYNCNGDQS